MSETVSLKADVLAEIEEFVKNSQMYHSVEEFVSEAIRLRMEQVKKQELKKATY